MSEAWVVLETSGRGGHVGLAVGGELRGEVALDPARRHNRDLAPAISRLLTEQGLSPTSLTGVMVSIGPGSFTGLRVGVMTAKSLAWALDCQLVTVPTFDAIAEQSPLEARVVDVIADALQGLVYSQRFERNDGISAGASSLIIEPATEWAARLGSVVWVSGPGVEIHTSVIPPDVPRVPSHQSRPNLGSIFAVGRRRQPLTRDELLQLEPLYLRASSAEEKAARMR